MKPSESTEDTTKYTNLFEETPIALIEQNLSEVFTVILESLASSEDPPEIHFEKHPEVIDEIIDKLIIAKVNRVGLDLVEAKDLQEVQDNRHTILSGEARKLVIGGALSLIENEISYSTEGVLNTIHGKPNDVIFKWNVLPEEEGISVVCSFINLSELKRVEKALEEERRQLLSIFNSFEQGIYVTDTKTHEILFVNNYLKTLFGRALVGGICYKEFQGFDEPCPFCTNDKIIDLGGAPYTWEYHNPLIDGHFLITDRIIKWVDGRDVRLELAVNITDLKKAQEAYEEAQTELIKKEKLATLGHISGSIGHELRNPLAAISNAAYLLNMAIPDSDTDAKEVVGIIEKEVRKCDRIITGLNDFAREKKLTLRMVNPDEIIRECIDTLDFPRGITLELDLVEDAPLLVGDDIQLLSVFTNIVKNAIQAMPNGGVLKLSSQVRDNNLVVRIEDSGVGIPQENLSKVFDPLFTTKAKGIGLGLAITKSIVDAHGGRILIESAVDVGTTFQVELPLGKQ